MRPNSQAFFNIDAVKFQCVMMCEGIKERVGDFVCV